MDVDNRAAMRLRVLVHVARHFREISTTCTKCDNVCMNNIWHAILIYIWNILWNRTFARSC